MLSRDRVSSKSAPRPLAFVIHDLNSWGGHDRSTLEIARRLSFRWPIHLYSYTLQDPKGLASWGEVKFHRIFPRVERPVAAKLTWFYGATFPALRWLPRLAGKQAPLVHATGACSLASDVVQVQFVNAAWKVMQQRLPEDVCAPPFARGKSGLSGWARKAYHEWLLDYNVAVEHQVYKKQKTYIAIAHSVAAELQEYFGIREHLHVIHHGVDSTLFRPASKAIGSPDLLERERIRSELGITPEELVIAFVGAYERKGLAVAIDALARLPRETLRKVRLLAIGGGAEAAFRSRARALGVEDRLAFLGHCKDVSPYYRASDLFLLPTLYEPFGLVILEAMASGLPAIVSKLAGASELMQDGISGRLIQDPMDPDEIARLVTEIVNNEPLRQAMGEAARAVAVVRSWDLVAEEYAAVLKPLLEARG